MLDPNGNVGTPARWWQIVFVTIMEVPHFAGAATAMILFALYVAFVR